MKRKKFTALLIMLVLFMTDSAPVLAAETEEFLFGNTKGLKIDIRYSEPAEAFLSTVPVVPSAEGKDENDAKEEQNTVQSPSPVPADYDNVEMGDNMFQAFVDGVKMTFYLDRAKAASDGYEMHYISFTPEGAERYYFYFRIPFKMTAGSYSSGKSYFSISTSYNKETGKWDNSYKAIYDGNRQSGERKSTYSGNWGSYTLTLDQKTGFEEEKISGTLSAEMEGYSSSTKGMTISVTNGVFRAAKGETHQMVQDWKAGTLAGSSASQRDPVEEPDVWTDPYGGTEKEEKKVCSKCGGNGRIICSICNGSGTLLQRKEGIDLGSGSTGYTVEVDCACDNGYYRCSWCGGSGYEN